MKILVKFPSRERPQKFIENLRRCIDLSTMDETHYLISLDWSDPNKPEYERLIAELGSDRVEVFSGYSGTKVRAVNRDLEIGAWDICIVVSDDQIPQMKGWDKIISDTMEEHFPDTNGALWFSDGYQPRINTQCIFGREYYRRFGYIYHPSYKSLWCDNEFTEVSAPVTFRSDQCIFKHEHYSNTGAKMDRMMQRTESFYDEDGRNFKRRKALGFPI